MLSGVGLPIFPSLVVYVSFHSPIAYTIVPPIDVAISSYPVTRGYAFPSVAYAATISTQLSSAMGAMPGALA